MGTEGQVLLQANWQARYLARKLLRDWIVASGLDDNKLLHLHVRGVVGGKHRRRRRKIQPSSSSGSTQA